MKLISALRYFPLLVLLFCSTVLEAQLFSPPQAFMNHKGYGADQPPANCSSMQLRRYIPGARFPGGLDVVIEDFAFDKAGHLLTWRKYRTVMGDLMLETNYKWNADGHIEQERILAAGNPVEIIRNYIWESPNDDGGQKAAIKNNQGKVIGSFEYFQDGSSSLVENVGANGQKVTTNYNAKGDVIKVNNENTGIEESFQYDGTGWLIGIEARSKAGTAKIKYANKKDGNGQIVSQTETGKGAAVTKYFQYDENGRLAVKGNSPTHIGELRNYDNWGRLLDVVYFDENGLPKETIYISYTSFQK